MNQIAPAQHDAALLPLTRGKLALVDPDDFERLSAIRWHAYPSKKNWYASGYLSGGKTVMLHRYIIGAPPHLMVDHINHDGLDCRKANLRFCTPSQNQGNLRPRVGRLRGVKKSKCRWTAQIKVFQTNIFFGNFGTPEDAARAYDFAALAHWGEFAQVNFPTNSVSVAGVSNRPHALDARHRDRTAQ